jgi:hypothetical protein
MASKIGRKLSEAEMNAPDLDEDGNLDVEHYPVPLVEGDDTWNEAARQLNDEPPEDGEP